MPFIFHTRINEDGTQSLRYQVNYRGKKWPVPTGYKCKRGNFKNGRIKGANAEVNQGLRDMEASIEKAVKKAYDSFPRWSIDQLKNYIGVIMKGGRIEGDLIKTKIIVYWMERIKYYESFGSKKKKQYKNAEKHANSMKVLFNIDYYPPKNNPSKPGVTEKNKNLKFGYLDEDLCLDELTFSKLEEIKEELLLSRSSSSVHGYFSNLSTIFTRAMIQQPKLLSENPFKGFRLPPMESKTESPLEYEEMVAILNAKCKHPVQIKYRDMAFWAYYCAGMRVYDVLTIPPTAIKNNRIKYKSNKTGEDFDFLLHPEAVKILERYKPGEKYLWDVVNPKLSGDELEKSIESWRKTIRKSLCHVARYAEVNRSVGMHAFRHTYKHLNDHIDLAKLSKSMGHKTIRTTEGYGNKKGKLDSTIVQIKTIN